MTEVRISLDMSIQALEALVKQNEGANDSYTRGVLFGYTVALTELKRAREVMESKQMPVAGCPF